MQVNPYGINTTQIPSNAAFNSPIIQNAIAQSQAQSEQTSANLSNKIADSLQTSPKIALEIRKFSDGVKGANELIGAMQIADITLKKAQSAPNLNEADTLANAAKFGGESIFGRELSLNIANEKLSLQLPLPSQIDDLSAKRSEISQKLGQISGLIEKASTPVMPQGAGNYDFENFDAAAFMKMARGN